MEMEERLQGLEIKIAFVEKQISDLDGVVRELGDAVVAMREELTSLRTTLRGISGDGAKRADKLEDDAPPHY